MTSKDTTPQLLSIKELSPMLSLSKTTIYKLLKENQFPKPFLNSYRCTRWRMADIQQWLKQGDTTDGN